MVPFNVNAVFRESCVFREKRFRENVSEKTFERKRFKEIISEIRFSMKSILTDADSQ
jgi:hypothetical protein